jgi:uncharacterized SAM-binding protein YcdF (DUF218 family)
MIALLARLLGVPLEIRDAPGPADAIVILGAPTGPVLDERVLAGLALWRAGAAPKICVTGGASRGCVEADAMAEALRAHGVPDDALIVEPTARTTAENAARVAALLAPGAVVWLVSQPFHLRRARWLFRRAGLAPRCWRIDGGLQDQDARRALRWIGREYAAWLRALASR